VNGRPARGGDHPLLGPKELVFCQPAHSGGGGRPDPEGGGSKVAFKKGEKIWKNAFSPRQTGRGT